MKQSNGNRKTRESMHRALSVLGCLVAFLVLVSSCKHAQPQTAAHAAPPPETAKPAIAAQPAPAPPPAATDAVMSEDLATLNSRGYLKDAFFDYDRADLREDARTALAADSQWLKRYPVLRILVEGHCDERGTDEYNLALGEKRASAVEGYLASLGVDAARVKMISYGKDRPFCTDANQTCWQDNRRGHFVITAK